jgi:hypothetical protein
MATGLFSNLGRSSLTVTAWSMRFFAEFEVERVVDFVQRKNEAIGGGLEG